MQLQFLLNFKIRKNLFFNIRHFKQATGIGGRGYFWYTPLAENFSKIPPPLEILVIPVAWL